MGFYIKDKNGNYRGSDGSWGNKASAEEFQMATYGVILHYHAAQNVLDTFSRMSLAETEAKVVEE